MKTSSWLKNSMALVAAFTLAGCGSMMQQNRTVHYSSSLYSYLNTNDTAQANSPLPMPLKVGIAFVPAQYSSTAVGQVSIPGENITANDMELLRQIGDEFKKSPCIKSVELLPTTYLSPGGGFDNLKHIRATLGLDAMVLVAYDQTQFSDEGMAAFSYWTIVGAYVVKGERNATTTVVESGFYDIGNQRLLFRAQGASTVKGSATPVNLSKGLRSDSQRGFEEAATNLVSDLKVQLAQFNEQAGKTTAR